MFFHVLLAHTGMTVQFVSQTRVVDQAQLSALEKTAGSELWEGIVLRKDVPYIGQRVYAFGSVS